ncbi:hypothetical protein EWM64_g3245 [Hericium alpestre]|uniref:BRCT domain-containing protein n=1 Tax=Hericium alpestre TaxID=135208 RepID=A0A4Z0A379_9AGAM|nr:hypothetical protein EWM64_g3245 [Hericium alpestre]
MATAPLQTSNTTTMPNLFVDSNHQPLNVFVDASGVQRRPKLIRALRNSGAKVCLIGEARILLVDPESTSGKNYIRDWANDANKVVLTASWVQKCLDKGRALLDADNWGGCVAEDDGQPIMSDGDQDEEAEEAEAEPEPEPEDFSRGTSHQAEVNYTPTASGSNIASQVPIQLQGPSFTQNAPPQQLQMQQQQLQQQLMPHANMNMMSMLPYYYPNFMQYPTQNALPVLTTLVETAIAVSRHNNLDTTLLQAALTSLPMYQSQAPQTPQTPTQQPGGQQAGQNFYPAASEHPLNGGADLAQSPDRASPITHEEPIPRPSKRKSHPSTGSGPQSSQSAKTKLRKAAASPMAATSSRPRPSQAAATSFRSQAAATPSRPPSVHFLTQPPSSQGRHRERSSGVFANPPQPFFVQIDIRNRRDIVQAVKRNGGTLSFEIPQSHYAVLNPRSTTFKDLASDARRFQVPIVQPAFVDACVAHGELLDPEPYMLEAPAPPKKQTKKKARHSPSPPIDSFRESQVPKQEPSVESSSRSGTPDIPPHREQLMSGRFVFTEEEWDFCWQYTRRLLEHDPNISLSALGQKLHEKLPHHSASSWQTSIQKRKHLLDEIREEVLASRSDLVNGGAGPSTQERQNHEDIEELDDEDSTKVDCAVLRASSDLLDEASAMATLVTNATDDQFREDFETIVSLIFSADWEGVPETEIWARMAAERSCRSAPDWDQFLDEHHEAVASEVERRSLETAAAQAAAEA